MQITIDLTQDQVTTFTTYLQVSLGIQTPTIKTIQLEIMDIIRTKVEVMNDAIGYEPEGKEMTTCLKIPCW